MRTLFRHWHDDSPSLLLYGRLLATMFGFIAAPLIARLLGPDGRGDTAAAAAVYYVVPILIALGVPTYIRRAVAVAHSLTPIRTSRRIALLTTIPAAVLCVLSFNTLFSGMNELDRLVASLGVLAAPLTVSWMCDIGALVAQSRFRAIFVMSIAQPTVYLSALLMLWVTGTANVAAAIGASVFANFCTFVVGMWFVRPPLREQGEKIHVWKMAREGVKYAGAAIAEAALNRGDQVVMLPILGAYQAGIYSVAATIATLPVPIGQAIGASYFAVVARSDGSIRRQLITTSLRSALISAVALTLILAPLTPILVPLLFGAEFVAAIPATLIALIGTVPVIVGFVAATLLAASGRGLTLTVCQAGAAVASLGLLVVLGSTWGAVGAAVASTVGYALACAAMVLALRPHRSVLRVRRMDLRTTFNDLVRKRDTEN